MKLYVLSEPDYRDSPYCIQTMQSLTEAARRKRVRLIEVDRVTRPEAEDDSLILIPAGFAWLEGVLHDCHVLGISPVVLNCHVPARCSGSFCYVNSDVREAMDYLAARWAAQGITRPALYAANPNSISDAVKIEQFLAVPHRHSGIIADEADIYYNHGSLQDCASAFLTRLDRYDCVICTNKFAAIHLWRALPEAARSMAFISYGSSLRIEQDLPGLCSISMSYEDFGQAALNICELRRHEPSVCAVSITVRCRIKTGDGDFVYIPRPSPGAHDPAPQASLDRFYRDADVHAMVLVENMINTCDQIDLAILTHLLADLSYAEIAQRCYLSHSALKYRIQKMRTACACATRAEFVSLLRHYHAWA